MTSSNLLRLCLIFLLMAGLTSCGESSDEDLIEPESPGAVQALSQVDVESKGLTSLSTYISINGDRDIYSAIYGSRMSMNFQNIDGFIVQEGQVFIETMHLVTNPATGDTLHFEHFGQTPAAWYPIADTAAVEFHTAMMIEAPLYSSVADKFLWKTGIKDASSGNQIIATAEIDLNPNPMFNVRSQGIEYAELYLYNTGEKRVNLSSEVSLNNPYNVVLSDPSGFVEVGGKVFPGIQIRLKNSAGVVLFEIEDMAEGAVDGVPYESIVSGLSPGFMIEEENATREIELYVRFWDKKSDNFLESNTTLRIPSLSSGSSNAPNYNF